MHRSARLSVLSATILALGGARYGHADDEPKSEAVKLFEQGRDLVRAGNNTAACPLFEKSLRLAPALGTELNLARCYAATGRLVKALGLYKNLVRKTANAEGQEQRAQLAKDGLDELLQRMPKLSIARGDLSPDASIRVDGQEVDISVPIPVDPGTRKIEAKGARPAIVEAKENETTEVTLEAIETIKRPDKIKILALSGAGAFALGSITGLFMLRDRSNGLELCGEQMGSKIPCPQEGADLLNRAQVLQHFTTVFMVAGVGLAAAALYFELDFRRSRETPVPTAWASGSSAGIGFGGVW